MRSVFADTAYYIAVLLPGDALHEVALAQESALADAEIVTSDAVLTELLAHASGLGPATRAAAAHLVREVLGTDQILVTRQDPKLFDVALGLYESRLDKAYSLVDCMSMVICREQKITEVLTFDRHFIQEGFKALLRHG